MSTPSPGLCPICGWPTDNPACAAGTCWGKAPPETPAYLDPVRDELATLRATLDEERRFHELRSEALNRTGADNDRLRATIATLRKLVDDEPLIVHSVRRDMQRTPFGRGGALRHEPATPKIGAGGCPGDNLVRWVMEIRAALADQEPARD